MTLHAESSGSKTGEALWLVVVWDQGREVVSLPAGDDRAVVIGSGRHADVRIAHPRVAPVQFHVERDRDGVWVVPGPPGGLRLNAVRVTAPHRLDGQAILEFAGVELDVRVEAEEPEGGTAKPELRVDRAYVAGLPSDTETTEFAGSGSRGTGESPFQLATVQMDVVEPPQGGPGEQRTELMTPFFDVSEQPTELMSPLAGGEAPAARLDPISTLDTTVFEAPLLPASPVLPVPTGLRRSAPALPRARNARSTPWRVVAEHRTLALGAGAGSFLLALVLGVLFVRAPAAPSARPPSAPASAARPADPAPVPAPRDSVATATSVVVSPASTTTDPEVARAVLHLAAGREEEAVRAYAALAARFPGDPALGALARLLSRRTDARCKGTVGPSCCPEVAR